MAGGCDKNAEGDLVTQIALVEVPLLVVGVRCSSRPYCLREVHRSSRWENDLQRAPSSRDVFTWTRHHRHSVSGGCRRSPQFALENRDEVVRGKTHPLRYELASPDASSRCGSSRSPRRWSESLRMPTPRAAWLEEPLSVEPDLSRPSSLLEAPPIRVRFRTAASRVTHRLAPIDDHSTSENQAPTS